MQRGVIAPATGEAAAFAATPPRTCAVAAAVDRRPRGRYDARTRNYCPSSRFRCRVCTDYRRGISIEALVRAKSLPYRPTDARRRPKKVASKIADCELRRENTAS